MKKIISLMLVFLLIFSFAFTLSSCGDNNPPEEGGENNGEEENDGGNDTPGNPEISFPIVPVKPIN